MNRALISLTPIITIAFSSCEAVKSCCGMKSCKTDTTFGEGACNKCGKKSCDRNCSSNPNHKDHGK